MMDYHRTDEEWIALHRQITAGHLPHADACSEGMDRYEQHYREGIWLRDLLRFKPTADDVVLDVGCGNGRLGIAVLPYGCQYIGLEPMQACVDWCRMAFAPWPRFRFEYLDVYYRDGNQGSAVDPVDAVFPVEDESVTWAAAISVFTHLCGGLAAMGYVSKMLKALKPGGILHTTWFRSPPNEPCAMIERTVYEESFIRSLLRGTDWLYDERGDTTAEHDQWRIWCRKR